MRAELEEAGVREGMGNREILRLVNEHVNRKVAYSPDDRSYSQRDFWAKPSETISKQAGDCEDFAILKMHLLLAAGYKADQIRFVLARDLGANQDHAFLVVFTPNGSQVLDNNIDRVYSVKEAVDIRPIMSFSENNRWVHGIRDEP
jgi:predicted transglutaminase-like cysteine proteinase